LNTLLFIITIWLWFNCGALMWAHLTSGGSKMPTLIEWVLIVFSPFTCMFSGLYLIIVKSKSIRRSSKHG